MMTRWVCLLALAFALALLAGCASNGEDPKPGARTAAPGLIDNNDPRAPNAPGAHLDESPAQLMARFGKGKMGNKH